MHMKESTGRAALNEMMWSTMTTSLRSTEDCLDAAEECAYRHGRCFDSYLIMEPGRQHFWSSDGQGIVGFVRLRKYIKSSREGLLAPEENREALLSELVAYAEQRKLFLSFYNITEDQLPLFEKYGFQATKWGEEPIVDLANQTWTGKAFEWVRRQTNYCRRQGLVLQEYREDLLSADESDRIMAELREVTAELVKTRPQTADIKFMQGELDPDNLRRKRIFLALVRGGGRRADRRLPGLQSRDERRFLGVRDLSPSSGRRAGDDFVPDASDDAGACKAEGVRHVSLCLVPGMGCNQPRPGDSALARWGFVLAARYLGFLFDTPGMYHTSKAASVPASKAAISAFGRRSRLVPRWRSCKSWVFSMSISGNSSGASGSMSGSRTHATIWRLWTTSRSDWRRNKPPWQPTARFQTLEIRCQRGKVRRRTSDASVERSEGPRRRRPLLARLRTCFRDRD